MTRQFSSYTDCMGLRFQSDKGLQSHYNTKHDWHKSHANEDHQIIETRAQEKGYPRYALPAAEVVSIADSSSSVGSLEKELNFEHVEENLDEEAIEEPQDQGRNNPKNEITVKNSKR